MACVAPFPDASVLAYDPAPAAAPACVGGALEIAGRGALTVPDEAIGEVVELTRARLGLGVGAGPLWGRMRVGATRSADDDSYVGIAGEAWVPAFEHAVAGGTWRGFTAELGLVPDPWVYAGNRAWGLDALAPTFAEEVAWIPASDAGVSLGWRGFGDRVDATAVLVTGEGANRRERNEGKDVAGSLSIAPTGTSALVASVYGRNGSRGLGYVPGHRAGARISGEVTRIAYGAEALMAWGVGDDATREPTSASAWVRARPIGPGLLAVRGDACSEDLQRAEALAWRLVGGAGVSVDVPGATLVALAGADHTTLGEAVSPFPGAPVAATSTTVFLHVGLELGVRSAAP